MDAMRNDGIQGGANAPSAPLGAAESAWLAQAAHARRTAIVIAWLAFWVLLTTVALQDELRLGGRAVWKRVLWEGTSFVVASVIAWAAWRRVGRHDVLLMRPWR